MDAPQGSSANGEAAHECVIFSLHPICVLPFVLLPRSEVFFLGGIVSDCEGSEGCPQALTSAACTMGAGRRHET